MMQSPFGAFLEKVEARETSDLLFSQCLSSPWGDKFEILHYKVDISTLSLLVSRTELIINSSDASYEDELMEMKRVAAVCLSLVKNCPTPNIRLTAAKELLLLSSIPGSRGNDISTPSVLEHIPGVLVQQSGYEMDGKTSPHTHSSTSTEFEDERDMNDDDDDMDTYEKKPCADVSVFKSFSHELIKQCQLFMSSGKAELLDGFVDAMVALLFMGSIKTDYASLKTIASDALDHAARSNPMGILSIMRCLLPSLSMRCDDSKIPANAKARTLCHRAAVKITELLVCDISAMNEGDQTASSASIVMDESIATTTPVPATPTPSDKLQHNTEIPPDTIGSTSTAATTNHSPMAMPMPPPKPVLPTGYAAVVGVLQRVLLSCPDKAPIRSQVASSICAIVKAMVSPLSHKKHATSTSSSNQENHANITKTRQAVDRFLIFTASILKSSKVARRSFAVEVAALLIRLPNIWYLAEIDDGSSGVSGGVTTSSLSAATVGAPYTLLLAMFGRCRDVAATVRVRALTSVAAILDDLGAVFGDRHSTSAIQMPLALQQQQEGSQDASLSNINHFNGFPIELCQALYSLIVEDSFTETSQSAQNFVDTLKLLAVDEKPTTRVKALRAYGTALSIRWPKFDAYFFSQSLSKELETTSMLVTDDDITMFATACSDPSVSVRKQAVDTVTDLLVSRPVDAFLQDTWVASVLPLMVDPEVTVQQKVSQSIFCVVLETAMEWIAAEQGLGDNSSTAMSTSLRSLGWVLCGKLIEAGLYNMLKSAVKDLLKSGYLCVSRAGAATGSAITIKDLVGAMEVACTLNFEQTDRATAATISAHDDRELVSHGGWVLLETLIDNENSPISNASGSSTSGGSKCSNDLDSLYKSDFVIRCWEFRMAASPSSGSSSDDVRILRVLQSMASRNKSICTSDRFKVICKQLLVNICAMNCHSTFVSAAIGVVFAPMSCFRSGDSGNSQAATGVTTLTTMGLNDPAFSDWFDGALSSLGRVMDVAYSVLHAAVVGRCGETPRVGLFGGNSTPAGLPIAATVSSSSSSVFPRRSAGSSECFGQSDISISDLNAAVFAIGEISMLGFSPDEEDLFTTVRSHQSEQRPNYAISKLSNGTYKILIPEVLVKLIQMLMPDFLPSSPSVPSTSVSLSQVDYNISQSSDTNYRATSAFEGEDGTGVRVHTSVRANAFIAIGKLCVRDKARATKLVNIFLRELQIQDSTASVIAKQNAASVRSNALLILGDLCVRFTNLVDRHIGTLASCLQDDDVIVRKNAFVLLVQLLVQDFLKWRGMLLYRFLAIVVDSDEDMAEFAKIALKKALDGKFAGIFKQHFVEAVVILNDCRSHPAFIANETSGGNDGGSGECLVDLRGVDLSGARNRSRRMRVYDFIMDGMSEEDKIQATAKLVQDILAHAVDNSESIRPPRSAGDISSGNILTATEEVISDTFKILKSPMLKVGGGRKPQGGDEDVDVSATENERADTLAHQAMHNAKIKVLKKLSVQHMIEHVLPVVSSLKHSLERCRSQLQRSLMEYLCDIVRNHKSEVEQALAQDPCLKAEIEYDIRIFERGKEQEAHRLRLQAAELAADSALLYDPMTSSKKSYTGSTRKSLGNDSGIRGFTGSASRRKSFGSLSAAAKSPMLKRSAQKDASVIHDENNDFSLASALDDSNSSIIASPTVKRWSISLPLFTDQNCPTADANREVTGIPQGNFRSPVKGKAGVGGNKARPTKTLPIERSDGTSPMKKKSRVVENGNDDTQNAMTAVPLAKVPPFKVNVSRGRGKTGAGDSLTALSK